MSSLVDFEDLGLLDAADLRAVFGQVEPMQMLVALVGTSASFRQRLLTKLPSATASQIEALVSSHDPVALEAVRLAQQACVDALCRLSRGGQIAFDAPEDMVA